MTLSGREFSCFISRCVNKKRMPGKLLSMFSTSKSFKLINAGVMAASVLMFFASPVLAEPVDYFDLPPEQLLNAEVVSVSRRAETVSHSPAAVYVITNEDIIRSGVTTIPDALRMAPGVQVAHVDSNSWAVTIRGFNDVLAKRLLVLIDGRTVYNTLHGGVYWEAHNIAMADIERIEVVRGPGGTLWGANAVNGIINIIRKKASNTQGAMVTGGYGSHERGFGSARYGGSFGEDNYYRVHANFFDRDNYRQPNGTGANDEWDGYRAGFRADWGDYFTLIGDIYRVGADQNYQSFSLTAPYVSGVAETAVNKGASLSAGWNRQFDNGAVASIKSFIDYASRDETILSDQRHLFDTELQYNFPRYGRHDLVAGAGYRHIQDDLSGSDLTFFNPSSRGDSNYSMFVQDKITLVPDNWYLTLGSKLEYHHYTDLEYQPTARLQWFPDDNQAVWASASRAVRTPTRIERDLDITNFVLPPGTFSDPALLSLTNNEQFDSEKLVAYELGYRNQITSGLSLDAAVFYNEYHDMLSLEAAGATAVAGPPAFLRVPLVAQNEQSAETYGGEIVVDWNVNTDWRLTATYSYIELFVHAPAVLGISQEQEEGDAPVHQASLQSSWDINKAVSLDTKLYYVDDLPRYDVDDYVRLDLSLNWQVSDNIRFNIVGQNLVEDEHREFADETSINAAEIERSVLGKVVWEF